MKRMIKKYVMIVAVLLVILMFTSRSTASFLFSEGKIYERLPENSLRASLEGKKLGGPLDQAFKE